ncbi:MAG: hypothetical protein KAI18_02050 [Candidatus Aenigmarchaeota archaeon]|nr:hypothetical protein [Candidatus Aenigmarchaeota archaeon]
MAGIIGSAGVESNYPGMVDNLAIGPSSQLIDSAPLETTYPVKRNIIEGAIEDFGTYKSVSNLCPDIMTVISHILEKDLEIDAKVYVFCKNPRPDNDWSDSIITTSETELIHSDAQRSTYHDYIFSFMTADGSNYLYSLDLDSNSLKMRMVKDSDEDIYVPNIDSLDALNDLISEFPEIDSSLINMDSDGSEPYADLMEEVRNSEQYLSVIEEVSAILNRDYKFFIDDGSTVEYRPIVNSIYDCDDSGYVGCDEFKAELSGKIAMLTESEGGMDVILYAIGFDNRSSSSCVTLSQKSSYFIPDVDSPKETVEALMPKYPLNNNYFN